MIRKSLLLALGAGALLAFVAPASAQVIVPNFPQPKLPKLDGLPPELQKEFEKLQKDIELMQLQLNNQPGGIGGGMRWGGVHLKKPTMADQQKFGLPENEGLIVTGVDANSMGEKAGLKASDVLVKLNDKAVPNDANGFAKLVKDMKADDIDIVVLRDGKEQTIKGTKMPAIVQNIGGAGGIGRPGGLGGILIGPRIQIKNPRINPNPNIPNIVIPQGNLENLHLEMTINGGKYVRDQKGNDFSGEYSKDELKITVAGKLENGVAKVSEITIREGKAEAKKYASIADTPGQHRAIIQQLMPSNTVGGAGGAGGGLFQFPMIPELQPGFPGRDF